MRIRTIKPEFWASETLPKVSDKARLLAIGLLNYSDDEGYFWANANLVKSAIFPFDDESTTCRRLLDDLSRIDYIKLGTTSDGRLVGFVVNFAIHQKIDRPKPSKIKPLAIFDDESTTNRRLIDDASLLEQGTGNREQGAREARATTQNFAEIPSWDEFWAYCQTQACLLPAEWYARDKFEAANQTKWKGKEDWRAYARRCKGWWEQDGRPMKPNQNHHAKNQPVNVRNIGVSDDPEEASRNTVEFVKLQAAKRAKQMAAKMAGS